MGKTVYLVYLSVLAVSVIWLYCTKDTFVPGSIKGKRVLITGASSGIGEELAYQYARLGASIVVTGKRGFLLTEIAIKCKGLGATVAESVMADMTLPEDRVRVLEQTQKFLGGLDHLILNHALQEFHPWTGAPENLTTVRKYLDMNFLTFVELTSLTSDMLSASNGSIGVVSSIAGKFGIAGMVPFVTSEFALHGFFSALRQELEFRKSGVSVTLCILGLVHTQKDVSTDKSMDVRKAVEEEETAVEILKAVSGRIRELQHPLAAKLWLDLHKVFPQYVESYVSGTVQD